MPRLFKAIAELLRTVRRRVRNGHKHEPEQSASANANLIAEFIRLAEQRYNLVLQHQIGSASKVSKKLYKTFGRKIRSLPDGGRAELTQLIKHKHPAVRESAAYLLLSLDERLALRTLKQLSRSSIYEISFSCEMTIKEWKAGNLGIDWLIKG